MAPFEGKAGRSDKEEMFRVSCWVDARLTGMRALQGSWT